MNPKKKIVERRIHRNVAQTGTSKNLKEVSEILCVAT